MIWTAFSEKHPIESGEYWIYRNRDGNTSRIIMLYYFRSKKGVQGKFSNGFGSHNKKDDWTHWMKIERPKPPKIKK